LTLGKHEAITALCVFRDGGLTARPRASIEKIPLDDELANVACDLEYDIPKQANDDKKPPRVSQMATASGAPAQFRVRRGWVVRISLTHHEVSLAPHDRRNRWLEA